MQIRKLLLAGAAATLAVSGLAYARAKNTFVPASVTSRPDVAAYIRECMQPGQFGTPTRDACINTWISGTDAGKAWLADQVQQAATWTTLHPESAIAYPPLCAALLYSTQTNIGTVASSDACTAESMGRKPPAHVPSCSLVSQGEFNNEPLDQRVSCWKDMYGAKAALELQQQWAQVEQQQAQLQASIDDGSLFAEECSDPQQVSTVQNMFGNKFNLPPSSIRVSSGKQYHLPLDSGSHTNVYALFCNYAVEVPGHPTYAASVQFWKKNVFLSWRLAP